MSSKEVPRAGLLKAALAGRITNAQGARALRLSVRQFRRLKRRFREQGARGLLHVLRGRPGNRRLAAPAREQIGVLMTTTYAGFNDVHLTEKLAGGPPPRRQPLLGTPHPPRPRAAGHPPAGGPAASQPAPPQTGARPTRPTRRQPIRLVRGPRPPGDAAWGDRRCDLHAAGPVLPSP